MTTPVTLYGTQSNGETLPVQVDEFGRLVAEGLQGSEGPPGPPGTPGADGGSFPLPPDPYEGALLGWLDGGLAWIGTPPVPIEEGVFGPITEVSEDGMAITVEGEVPAAIGTGVYVYQCNPAGEIYVPTWNNSQVWSVGWKAGFNPLQGSDPADSFDGLTTTTWAVSDAANTWLAWEPSTPVAYSIGVEVYAGNVSGTKYKVNGGAEIAAVVNGWKQVTSGVGNLTRLEVTRSVTDIHAFFAVKVDGKFLVDGGTYPSAHNLNFRVQNVAGNMLVGTPNRTDVAFSVGSYLRVPGQRVAPWVLRGGQPATGMLQGP